MDLPLFSSPFYSICQKNIALETTNIFLEFNYHNSQSQPVQIQESSHAKILYLQASLQLLCEQLNSKPEFSIIILLYRSRMEQNHLIELMPFDQAINIACVTKGVFNVTIADEEYQSVTCFLFQNCIVLKTKANNLERAVQSKKIKIRFDFQPLLQIREEFIDELSNHSVNYSISLEKQRISVIIKFYNNVKQHDIWKAFLRTKLSQKGFHRLFKAIKKIGKGNYANVYLVNKLQNEQQYAVKAFSKESLLLEDKGKESLMKQISIMRQFDHKNLMKIYQVYETEHSTYLVTELLEGGQLTEKINKRLSPAQIKVIMRSILEGLKCMHSNNIMHRDIKPQNILLRRQGEYECVLVDFGLAESTKSDFLFVRCGTPGYVAPEIVNLKDHNAKYSCACDMFSLGVIFHMLILKKSPFPGREYDEVLQQNKDLKFDFESNEYKNMNQNAFNLLKRMLENDPSKRITAAEALEHSFFAPEKTLQKGIQKCNLEKVEGKEEGTNSRQAQSPLMMTKNLERKKISTLREDSCLKFKMKQNLVATGELIDQISSPSIQKKRISALRHESRFKQLASHQR